MGFWAQEESRETVPRLDLWSLKTVEKMASRDMLLQGFPERSRRGLFGRLYPENNNSIVLNHEFLFTKYRYGFGILAIYYGAEYPLQSVKQYSIL